MAKGANPVVLVHGILDTVARLGYLESHLRENGLPVYSLDLVPNDGRAGIEVLARQLADFVAYRFPSGQLVDLVGYSMGGLVCRYYLQQLGGRARVRKLVAIATPHRGTWTAFLWWSAGVRQMRPGSEFLRELNSDATSLDGIDILSLWTPFDLTILPAASSVFSRGQTTRVNVAAHPWMARDRRVVEIVDRFLAT